MIRRPWVLAPDDERLGRFTGIKIHECLAAPFLNGDLLAIEAATKIEADYWINIVYEISKAASVLSHRPFIHSIGTNSR